MNKLLTKIVGVVIGTSMAVGVGTAVITKNAQGINSEVNAAAGDSYSKVTDASTLTSGDVLTIVSEAKGDALSTTQNNNNRGAQAVTINNDSFNWVSGVQEIELSGTSGAWILTAGSVRLSGVSGQNYLKNGTDTWTIAISSGNATITSAASGRVIKRNNSSALYATYSSGQTAVQIYKKNSSQGGSTELNGVSSISATVTAVQGAPSWTVSNVTVTGTINTTGNQDVTSYVDYVATTPVPATVENDYTVSFTISKKDGIDGSFTSGSFSVTNATTTANPFNDYVKVASASAVTTTDVYALGYNKLYFAGNSISSNGLPKQTTTGNVGFFSLDSAGYLATCTESAGVWTASTSQYLNNEVGKTDLSIGDASSVWEAVDDGEDGVMLQNTSNSNRYLGLNGSDASTATSIKAYATSNLHAGSNNLPVYLYKVGTLPAEQFVVSYDKNATDATGTMTDPNSPYDSGATVTVLANSFTYVGHSFTGWNTKSDGSGTPYSAGNTFTISERVTLYAQWEEVDYIAVKHAKVVIPLSDTYDITHNLTLFGSGALTISPMSTEFYSISDTVLTPSKVTTSDLTITVSKANVVGSVSFDIQIKKQSAGTIDDPLTVEEALSIGAEAGDSGTDQGYYVAGYIIGTPTFSSSRGRLYIGDTANSETTLYIYNMNGLGNSQNLGEGKIVEGDYIVALGMLKTYNSTPQLCYGNGVSNCELISVIPVEGYGLSLDSETLNIYVGDSHTFTITETVRDYLKGYELTLEDSSIGTDYTWNSSTKTFTAGSTKGQITLVATSTKDTSVIATCTISVNKRLTPPSAAGSYQKITKAADLTSGSYLIVYETGGVAFDGSLETLDATSNTISVTIDNGVIEANSATNASIFEYDATETTLQSASGLFIGKTANSNGMDTNGSTQYTHTISFDDDGNANIVGSGGAYLRYNSSSGQERFRYFKSDSYTGQKAIQLYKFVEGESLSAKAYLCKQIIEFVECDGGNTAPSTNEWAQLVTLYNSENFLSAQDKTDLRNATAASKDAVLPNNPTESDYIAIGLAKYDYIVGKYNVARGLTTDYPDFLNRSPAAVGSARIDLNIVESNGALTSIIVVVSLISLTTIGGYFLLRKRKEER